MDDTRQQPVPEIEAAFSAAILAADIFYTGPVIADGQKHRVALDDDKPGARSGEYALHADGRPAGFFRDYRKHGPGDDFRWKWEGDPGPPMDHAQREAQARERAERQAARERDERDHHERVAAEARIQWDKAGPPDPQHGYLRAKGMTFPNARQSGAWLLSAMVDTTGKMWGFQGINESGVKRYLPIIKRNPTDEHGKGPRKQGTFNPTVGDWKTAGRIFIGEGLATVNALAISLNDLNAAYIAAWDKGNLKPIAQSMHAARPDAAIIIIGDNDQWKGR